MTTKRQAAHGAHGAKRGPKPKKDKRVSRGISLGTSTWHLIDSFVISHDHERSRWIEGLILAEISRDQSPVIMRDLCEDQIKNDEKNDENSSSCKIT